MFGFRVIVQSTACSAGESCRQWSLFCGNGRRKRLGLLLVLALTSSGCHSYQAALRFRPVALAASPRPGLASAARLSLPAGRRARMFWAHRSRAPNGAGRPRLVSRRNRSRRAPAASGSARGAVAPRYSDKSMLHFSMAFAGFKSSSLPKPAGASSQRMAKSDVPVQATTAVLFMLGGVAIGIAGLLVGVALFSWGGLAAALGGLIFGLLAVMLGVFSIPGQSTGPTKSRFNLVTLAGWLTLLGGLALGWRIGGLLGVGVDLALLGFGALVTGAGVMVGIPEDGPPPGTN